ncbi:MAG: hypothetical protein K6T75_03525 [Acetobacteraceae bacterium]|nr:hypothetical protein [Acetobacteraceae bacterium]
MKRWRVGRVVAGAALIALGACCLMAAAWLARLDGYPDSRAGNGQEAT